MRITNAVLALAALLVGCGGMMTGSNGMRGAIGDAIDEDQQYLAGARAASSMPEMLGEADRHASRMTLIMEDMGDHMASMHHCSDIDSMMDLRDGLRIELDSHLATMHAETQMSSARAEVEHHVLAMGSMLDHMGSMLDRMHCGGW
jgi:hypothetical protein